MGNTSRELDLLVACAKGDMSGHEILQETGAIVKQEEILEEFSDAGRLGIPGWYNVVSYDRETVPYSSLDNPLDD